MRGGGCIPVALLLALQGCSGGVLPWQAARPDEPGAAAARTEIPPIRGVVDFGDGSGRQVATTMVDVARDTTVSMIDAASSVTLSTTKTNDTGQFILAFSGGFVPRAGTVYILEGVKGLGTNRPGNDAVRVRTFALFAGGGWSSIVSGQIFLNTSTTALAIMQGHYASFNRPGPGSVAASYIGLIAVLSGNTAIPDTLQAGQNVVDQATFELVQGHTRTAIAANQDPVHTVEYEPAVDQFKLLEGTKPYISDFFPKSASAGSLVTLYGNNFETVGTSNLVTFNGAPATVDSASKTRLVVRVPDDATSGPLIVETSAGRSEPLDFTVVPSFGGKFKGTQ